MSSFQVVTTWKAEKSFAKSTLIRLTAGHWVPTCGGKGPESDLHPAVSFYATRFLWHVFPSAVLCSGAYGCCSSSGGVASCPRYFSPSAIEAYFSAVPRHHPFLHRLEHPQILGFDQARMPGPCASQYCPAGTGPHLFLILPAPGVGTPPVRGIQRPERLMLPLSWSPARSRRLVPLIWRTAMLSSMAYFTVSVDVVRLMSR